MGSKYLPESILTAAHNRFLRFEQQYMAVTKALVAKHNELSIGAIILYGSCLTGVRPGSDIDLLILLSDDFKERGQNFLELQDMIEMCAEEACVNEIQLDLHIRSARSFTDTTHGTAFKKSVCANNEVLWEDGVTLDRRFITGA